MNTSLLVDILVSLLGGIITGFYFQKVDYAFFASLFLFFALELPRARYTLHKLDEKTASLLSLAQSFRTADEVSELKLIYGLRNLGGLKGESIIARGDSTLVFDFWRNCIARTRNKWQALSYVQGPWTLGWAKKSLLIQEERIRSGCALERIFVVDSPQEAEEMKAVIEEQKAIGIQVGWVLRDQLLSGGIPRDAYSKIGSLDFAIIDERWLYITDLADRKLSGAQATGNSEAVKSALLLFTEASAKANR